MSRQTLQPAHMIRHELLRQREALVHSGREERRILREGGETLGDTVQDEADLSELDLQTELDLALLEIRSEAIRHIDRAIERLDAGTYGRCDECGGPITAARLKALPAADRCVECAGESETHVVRHPPRYRWQHMFV